jgi:hypothetical protein
MRKKNTTWRDAIYYPLQQKTFEEALDLFLKEEFPALGGSLVRREIVKELKSIVAQFYPPHSHLKIGQILWPAVLSSEKAPPRTPMRECKTKPVTLTLTTPEELLQLRDGVSAKEIQAQRAVRMLKEAHRQGAVLAASDVAYILGVTHSTVCLWMRKYEREHNTTLPCRGAIQDIGGKLSHKTLICRKKYLENKSTWVIAQETNHSPEAIDRYLFDYDRVNFCLKRKMNLNEIAFSCKLSPKLVKEYISIIETSEHFNPN